MDFIETEVDYYAVDVGFSTVIVHDENGEEPDVTFVRKDALDRLSEENGKLRHLLSQVLPIVLKSNINNWCHACGYACDVQSGRCKWRESVLEEAEELEIEVDE